MEEIIRVVNTEKAAPAVGPYSQAIISGNLIFTSGQLPVDPGTGVVVQGDIVAQTNQAINNLEEILISAGSNLSFVVKTTCFLADMDDFASFNNVYESRLLGKPARSCVAVKKLPKNALIEIEAIAVAQ